MAWGTNVICDPSWTTVSWSDLLGRVSVDVGNVGEPKIIPLIVRAARMLCRERLLRVTHHS